MVGETLRQARIASNLTIEQVAEVTKIRPSALMLIEFGEYDQLPGDFFLSSFVRQYANAVGLDAEETLAALRAELSQTEAVPALPRPQTTSQPIKSLVGKARSRLGDSVRQNAGILGTVALAAALIAAGLAWLLGSYQVSDPIQASAGTVQDSPAAVEPTPPVTPAVPPPSPGAAADSATGTSTGPGTSFSVAFVAKGQSWVRTLADGTTERESTLRPGERLAFRADSLVQATVGNAGGIVFELDGRVQEALGEAGQVRHLRITKDGWTITRASEF